jgi:hypothetical protein
MPALPRPASGPGSRYTARAATTRPRPIPPARRHTDVVSLTHRLTERDLWLTGMVHEHRVLTAPQITRLAFSSPRSAQRRLRTLHQYAVLDSFRPLVQTGSAPEHYTLGPLGATLLAAHTGCEPAALGWRPTSTGRIAYSPSLGHDVGVNELLTLLAAQARHTTRTGLALWLSERSCARRWDDMIRPDAYAHWQDPSSTDESPRALPFFLEYDTGTQSLSRVEAKLAGYASFTTSTGTRPALLIHARTPPQCPRPTDDGPQGTPAHSDGPHSASDVPAPQSGGKTAQTPSCTRKPSHWMPPPPAPVYCRRLSALRISKKAAMAIRANPARITIAPTMTKITPTRIKIVPMVRRNIARTATVVASCPPSRLWSLSAPIANISE